MSDVEIWRDCIFDREVILVSNKGRLKINGQITLGKLYSDRKQELRIISNSKYINVKNLIYGGFYPPFSHNYRFISIDGNKMNNNIENLKCVNPDINIKCTKIKNIKCVNKMDYIFGDLSDL